MRISINGTDVHEVKYVDFCTCGKDGVWFVYFCADLKEYYESIGHDYDDGDDTIAKIGSFENYEDAEALAEKLTDKLLKTGYINLNKLENCEIL